MIDSAFYRDLFGTAEMRALFDDRALLQRWLDCEAALAEAQAEVGLISAEIAREIVAKAVAENFSMAMLEREMAATLHPIVPVIRALEEACAGEAGQYVHWGATTQDIMDTAAVLQLRDAGRLIDAQLDRIDRALIRLAKAYRSTPMVGRTHGQHAVPITFGYKAAIWLEEFRRSNQRLRELRPRLEVIQLFGAAGTLATLPGHGPAIQAAFARRLGLGVPSVAWHSSRDAFTEWCCVLGLIAGAFGKVAREVIALQKTEIDELAEPHNEGKVGSSTMPHKRNPMLCEAIVSVSQIVRGNVSTAMMGMLHEHERDMGPWQAEWEYLPEVTIATGGGLEMTARLLEGLEVKVDNMRRNLLIGDGVLCSEALMIALGEFVGRQRAHDLVYDVAMRAHEQGRPFEEAAREEPEVRQHLSDAEVGRLLDPTRYLGYAEVFVDQVLGGVATHA